MLYVQHMYILTLYMLMDHIKAFDTASFRETQMNFIHYTQSNNERTHQLKRTAHYKNEFFCFLVHAQIN